MQKLNNAATTLITMLSFKTDPNWRYTNFANDAFPNFHEDLAPKCKTQYQAKCSQQNTRYVKSPLKPFFCPLKNRDPAFF